ncbi:MAG: ABC transporter ATP-binding protein [Thermoanaerobaculia bacterium]|nr:ABC transporter ATP-binding protein [Thermoanaerobaculia bacterium]
MPPRRGYWQHGHGRTDTMGIPIHFENVSHRYGGSEDEGVGVVALDDVSLELEAGSFTAIMGASGSGKSTLLHIGGAIDRATAGRVLLGDVEISRMTDAALTLVRRERIGFVFQFFNLIPTLTVRENVRFPLDLLGTDPKARAARVEEVLQRIGLAHRAKHYPSELSGGEMQRVAIGRAIVHRPPVVLADEPTGNLDSRTGETILELLREIHRLDQPTIVMATHSDHAASFASSTVRVTDGRISREARKP